MPFRAPQLPCQRSLLRPVAVLLTLALPMLACDSGSGSRRGPELKTVSGYYDVEGVTTVVRTGDTRPITGSVILAQDGEAYTATFHLTTSFATADGNLQAEVIGSGAGLIDAEQLVGTAETQILTAAFPGVDTKFPFLAQRYGPRVVSKSVATVKPGGSIDIEIESVGADGVKDYAATHTSLKGVRGKPRGVDGFPLPEVGAGPR